MDEILKQLSQPVFWFASVFVAVIMSIAGNLITRALERWFSGVSSVRKQRRDKVAAEFQSELTQLIKTPEGIAYCGFRALAIMILISLLMIMSTIFMTCGVLTPNNTTETVMAVLAYASLFTAAVTVRFMVKWFDLLKAAYFARREQLAKQPER